MGGTLTQTRIDARRTGDSPSAGAAAWLAHLAALCVGLLGLGCALALPFAPVWTEQTQVRWPAADEPAVSTTALFAPYRPAEFTARIPCRTVRAALGEPDGTTIFSTLPPGSDRDGVVLAIDRGRPELVLGQRSVPLPPLLGACALTVHADAHQSAVTVDGQPPIALPGVPAPEIFTFATDLDPARAAELSIIARPFSWFDTEPTALKSALTTAAWLLAGCSLLLLPLLAHAPPRTALRQVVARRLAGHRPALLLVDALIACALGTWLVIGPMTDDDGFAMMTVRMHEVSGDIGNYYRWFNASETPFTLVQHLMRWVSERSLAPAWLRVPSAVAGGLTWLVVSRGLVAPVCAGTRRLPLHLVAAVLFLACWLPFGLGVRPEAFVALGVAAVVAALLKATSPTTTAPLFWLGTAAAATGLTAALTPTGVAAPLAVLVFAPRILRLVAERGALPRWVLIPTRVALLCCLGAVGVVAMFADSTWNGVRRATEIHDEFGPSLGWYQEIGRYSALLGPSSWGAAGKRLAVLLVLAAALIATACVLRRAHRWTGMPEAPLLLGSVGGVFAALWLTPSKWTHHFGALAGVGPALVVVASALLWRWGRQRAAQREVLVLGALGTGLAALAAALAFLGPNEWWQYSDLAMPWSDSPVRPGGMAWHHPLFWVVAAVAVVLAATAVVHIGRKLSRTERSAWTGEPWWSRPAAGLPGTALTLAALASVAVLLGTFLAAPLEMGGRFSVAAANRESLTGESCGIESEVETLPLAENGILHPVAGEAELDGFTGAAGLPSRPPEEPLLRREPGGTALLPSEEEKAEPISAARYAWGSLEGGARTTGSMTTAWFSLPPLDEGRELSFWVAGRPEQGNSLAVEFGGASGGAVLPIGRRELRDPPPTELPFDDPRHGRPADWRNFRPWRLMTIGAEAVPPGTDRVRLRAADTTTDEQGWLAVSGPVLREVVPLRDVVRGQAPALVDWPISFLFPCLLEYPRVGGGTAESPRVLVAPPAGESSMAFDPAMGGVFTGAVLASRRLETPSRLREAPGITWGHVYSVNYDRVRDTYDMHRFRIRTGGAEGDGKYPFEEH